MTEQPPEDYTLHHGIVIAILGEMCYAPGLPDWDLSYIKRHNLDDQQRAILKAGLTIVKVTPDRIYFEE